MSAKVNSIPAYEVVDTRGLALGKNGRPSNGYSGKPKDIFKLNGSVKLNGTKQIGVH